MKVVGNSHTIALFNAIEQAGLDIPVYGYRGARELTPFYEKRGDVVVIPNALTHGGWEGELSVSPDTKWALCTGHLGHVLNQESWSDLYRCGSGLLSRQVEETFVHVIGFLDAVAASHVRFALILAPPPRRNAPSLIKYGFPAEWVFDIDRIGRDVLREKARALGAPVIESPAEAADRKGFLRQRFCAGPRPNGKPDPHHANAAYGSLIVERLRSLRW